MSDKNNNPNDVYYWMTKKIDYSSLGYCLTEEEQKEWNKRAKKLRKIIQESEPGFIEQLEQESDSKKEDK